MRISDWSSDVCSSDLVETVILEARKIAEHVEHLPDRRDIIVHLREQLRRVRAVRNRRLAALELAAGRHDVRAERHHAAGFGHHVDHPVRSPETDLDTEPEGRSEEHTSELQSLMSLSY